MFPDYVAKRKPIERDEKKWGTGFSLASGSKLLESITLDPIRSKVMNVIQGAAHRSHDARNAVGAQPKPASSPAMRRSPHAIKLGFLNCLSVLP
jgi:hypothetical protein